MTHGKRREDQVGKKEQDGFQPQSPSLHILGTATDPFEYLVKTVETSQHIQKYFIGFKMIPENPGNLSSTPALGSNVQPESDT